jgi:hypothetical protein
MLQNVLRCVEKALHLWICHSVTNVYAEFRVYVHSQYCEKELLASLCLLVRPSVRLEQLGSSWMDFNETWYLRVFFFLENMLMKVKFLSNPTRITGPFHEDVFTFITISSWILLIMRNISNKSCRENQNTILCSMSFFLWKSCRLWDNVEKCGGAREATYDLTTWRIWFAYWISKATRVQAHARARALTTTDVYIHTVYNTYCFYTVTVVTWTRLCYVTRVLPVLLLLRWVVTSYSAADRYNVSAVSVAPSWA